MSNNKGFNLLSKVSNQEAYVVVVGDDETYGPISNPMEAENFANTMRRLVSREVNVSVAKLKNPQVSQAVESFL